MEIVLFSKSTSSRTSFNEKYFDMIYFADLKNIPYGTKTKEELFELSKKIIEFLESKKVDIIVIACGTVSSNIYEIKRKKIIICKS